MFYNSKKLKSLFKYPSGFTLAEILVVIVIIAVLGAIAAPVYMKGIKRSRASDALKVLSLASAKQEAYLISNERYAETFTELSAPVKGLVGGESVHVGYFDYRMEDRCLVASREEDGYEIYRNYESNETGCVGEGCDNLQGLIPTKGSVGCTLTDTGIGEGNKANDPCSIDPGLAGCNNTGGVWCNAGETKTKDCTGGQYQSCTASGQWDGECKCSAGQVLKEGICKPGCIAGSRTEEGCSGGQEKVCDNNGQWGTICECPKGKTLQDGVCVEPCSPGETRTDNCSNGEIETCGVSQVWDNKCECPEEKPYSYNSQCNVCREGEEETNGHCCEAGKEWREGKCEAKLICKIGIEQKKTCDSDPDVVQRRTFQTNGQWTGWTPECPEEITPPIPAVCEGGAAQACGNCGTQSCKADGSGWNGCTGEGVCTPGETGTNIPDPNCTGSVCLIFEQATCNDQCQWEYRSQPPVCSKTCGAGYTLNLTTCTCELNKELCSTDRTRCQNTPGATWNESTCSCSCPYGEFMENAGTSAQCCEFLNCGISDGRYTTACKCPKVLGNAACSYRDPNCGSTESTIWVESECACRCCGIDGKAFLKSDGTAWCFDYPIGAAIQCVAEQPTH
jgi:prepilin-type N-terminal cleavage/methylation domain-containing protein